MIVGRAVATGKLPDRQGDAVTRTVREWLKAHEAGAVSDRLERVAEAVAALKRGERPPVEVVK